MTAGVLPSAVTVPAPGARGVSLLLRVDLVEHQRRQDDGCRAITSPAALTALLALPEGLSVARHTLTSRELKALRHIPKGAAAFHDEYVTRLAVRPVRVLLATVRGTCSKTSLERAGRFAPFCARRVLTTVRPTKPETLIEYDFWGIGITYAHPDGREESLVEPRPWIPKRHTPAGWRFAEQAYQQYLDTLQEA